GGAVFTANNSVNAGGVTGITVNSPTPRSLYWVGGTGNWSDVNHWALSSGGAGGSCVPSQFDDVFFDSNSFPSANDTVNLNSTTPYCHNMDWSGATNSPAIYSGYLQIYGSLILNSSMHWNTSLTFMATTTGNIIN